MLNGGDGAPRRAMLRMATQMATKNLQTFSPTKKTTTSYFSLNLASSNTSRRRQQYNMYRCQGLFMLAKAQMIAAAVINTSL